MTTERERGSSLRIALEGRLGLRDVRATHKRLDEAMNAAAEIDVDLGAVTEIDVSHIQLLAAARKSAEQSGRTLRLNAPAGGAFHAAVVRIGLLGADGGCRRPDENFWVSAGQ